MDLELLQDKLLPSFDMHRTPIVRLAKPVAHHVKSDCLLALSGILSEQVDAVLDAYKPWIEFEEPAFRVQSGQTWARLTGARNKG